MPRKTRMYLPGIPAHVLQRGHNRDACIFADDDYQFYLEALTPVFVPLNSEKLVSGLSSHGPC